MNQAIIGKIGRIDELVQRAQYASLNKRYDDMPAGDVKTPEVLVLVNRIIMDIESLNDILDAEATAWKEV